MSNRSASRREYYTLGRHAYEELRQAIVNLRLSPGQAVYESELASMLEMSRTPIREAIRSLVAEELVEVIPQKGMTIALISTKKVEETRFVRELLEVGALREGMLLWRSDDAERIKISDEIDDCLRLQDRALNRGDVAGFLDADEAFHRAIVKLSNNETLHAVVKQMRAHLNRIRMLSLTELQNIHALIDEHRALFDRMQAQDESGAIDILTTHLRRLKHDVPVVKMRYPRYFSD